MSIEDRISEYINERATSEKIGKKEAQEFKKFIENEIEPSLEEAKDRLDDAYSGKDVTEEDLYSPLKNIKLSIEKKFS